MGQIIKPGEVQKQTAGGQIPLRPEYSIEIFLLDPKPLDTESTPSGIILVWAVNAVQDRAIAYMCPQCGFLFPPGYEQLVHAKTKEEYVNCKGCGITIPDMMLQTSFGFRTNLKKVAEQVAKIYQKARGNAGFRLRRFKKEKTFHDVVSSVQTVQYEDKLLNARSGKSQEWIDYPASRVTKDLETGADLVRTIHNFLKV